MTEEAPKARPRFFFPRWIGAFVGIAVVVLGATGTAHAGPPDVAVAIVDLERGDAPARAAKREELEKAIGGVQGLRTVRGAGLRAALAGERIDAQAGAGRRAVGEARTAFGGLDCARATSQADAAVLALAAAQATGTEVGADLVQAYAYLLLCADQAGDSGAAQAAARQLRNLGAPEPPPGVSDVVWTRYPALDATAGVATQPVQIDSKAGGGQVWIDHARAGAAPYSGHLLEGEHLVVVVVNRSAAVSRLVVSRSTAPLVLEPPAADATWSAVETRVHAWRTGAARRNPGGLGALLAAAKVTYAVVLTERGLMEVWQARGAKPARHLGSAADAVEIGALVQEAEARPSGPGIDPNVPLLRETAEERAAGGGSNAGPSHQEWWVYAAIIGAVVVGAGIVAVNEIGDDTQRIEITLP